MILVNNQFDAQFFMCVYFYSLFFFVYVYFYSVLVSDNHVPITRRIIVSMRHLIYVIQKQVNNLKLQNVMP